MIQVQVNTDNRVEGGGELPRYVESAVHGTLGRFADRITRVEVHLGDENSHKGGEDKRCTMEARPAGLRPLTVSHQVATLEQAVDGAAGKLERLLDGTFGKLDDRKGRTSYGGDQTI